MTDRAETLERLAGELRQGSCICVSGSGVSLAGGKPSWERLIGKLCERFAPEANDNRRTLPEVAEEVHRAAAADGREDEFRDYLMVEFDGGNPGVLHQALAGLEFRAHATLNYDCLMESAITQVRTVRDIPVTCSPIDLCADEPRRIFNFIRDIGRGGIPDGVLHLHGHCRRPRDLILTRSDYERFYGATAPGTALDTRHRKVIWALLTMYPVVFVGVGLHDDDPLFERMLTTVRHDFLTFARQPHFALVGYSSEYEREQRTDALRDKGIEPVFYEIVDESHAQLGDLLEEIRRLSGAPTISMNPTPSDISRRMMDP